MSGFFQNFAQDVAGGFFGNDYLRDYTHASKTFRPNAYQYAPKFKFLFHVYFNINTSAYAAGADNGANFGLAVKSIKLPSYNFDVVTLNQYNRKRLIQTKIKYDPIDIIFHDDNGGSAINPSTSGGTIRNLWYNYYTYYYKDATKPVESASSSNSSPNNTSYNTRNLYQPNISGDTDWGFIGETGDTVNIPEVVAAGQTKIPFFKNITVFGFNQHNYVAYRLINPIITRFAHDTYNYAEGNGTMENVMSLDYETVTYFQGAIDGKQPSNIVKGFGITDHYDTTLSPIARPGSNSSILGQGGLVDGAGGVINNLTPDPVTGQVNLLGAIQNAGATYNTLKNMNLKQAIKSEVKQGITNALMNPLNNTGRNTIFNLPIFGQTPKKYDSASGRALVPPNIESSK